MRASEFDVARDLAKIGKPVDKGEWYMTPPTVNAYYDPQQNNVNFPAGYFQPPFFSDKEDDAANYGDMGSTIGHELTHGFDDEGRQYRQGWQPQRLVDQGRPRQVHAEGAMQVISMTPSRRYPACTSTVSSPSAKISLT